MSTRYPNSIFPLIQEKPHFTSPVTKPTQEMKNRSYFFIKSCFSFWYSLLCGSEPVRVRFCFATIVFSFGAVFLFRYAILRSFEIRFAFFWVSCVILRNLPACFSPFSFLSAIPFFPVYQGFIHNTRITLALLPPVVPDFLLSVITYSFFLLCKHQILF